MIARLALLFCTTVGLAQLGHAADSLPPAKPNFTPLSITTIGKNTFMVRDPLTMTFPDGAPAITVPAGFVTELTSVPKRLHWWGGKTEASMAPAVIHDYLYWYQPCRQEEADAVMYFAMSALGGNNLNATAVYRAVSSTGSVAFKKNTDMRRDGDVRTFTAQYTNTVVQTASFDASETRESALRKAQASSGLVKNESASDAVKLTCARLLSQCTPCRDHLTKKKR
jgi:hypothetical protein